MAAVCVANWLPSKGIVELLEAVSGLPDDVVTLHLVGDTATRGGYAGRVHERIERADLRDRVVVHGLIEPAAVHQMYQTVDAFVLPSFFETYGTVWGEAMAAGLPVVGWQAGNLPFLADHGRDGVLVPVGDVRALGRAIEWLARDSALRARLGRAAYIHAAARPTWDETAARFFAIIHEVLAGHRTRAKRPRPGP
jgi:glycosyltransferase involved in cell wall biosynthesis